MKPLDKYTYKKVDDYFNRAHTLAVAALHTITREFKGETLKPYFFPCLITYDINGQPNRVDIQEYHINALGEVFAYDTDGVCHTINDEDEFLDYNLYELFMEIDKAQE